MRVYFTLQNLSATFLERFAFGDIREPPFYGPPPAFILYTPDKRTPTRARTIAPRVERNKTNRCGYMKFFADTTETLFSGVIPIAPPNLNWPRDVCYYNSP